MKHACIGNGEEKLFDGNPVRAYWLLASSERKLSHKRCMYRYSYYNQVISDMYTCMVGIVFRIISPLTKLN
jgi:hypothetical protein